MGGLQLDPLRGDETPWVGSLESWESKSKRARPRWKQNLGFTDMTLTGWKPSFSLLASALLLLRLNFHTCSLT